MSVQRQGLRPLDRRRHRLLWVSANERVGFHVVSQVRGLIVRLFRVKPVAHCLARAVPAQFPVAHLLGLDCINILDTGLDCIHVRLYGLY